MNRSGTVEYALQDLEPSNEPLIRRRSDGDIIHAFLSEDEDHPHLLRGRTLSFHHNFQQSTPDHPVVDDQSSERDIRDRTISSSNLTSTPQVYGEQCRKQAADKFIWSLWWLQPSVLGLFAGLFLCAAISLAVMMLYSKKNHGLCEIRSDLEYVWRFAPTAVLTIVAGFWSRTTFQAARYMPWIELQHAKFIENIDFLLDYTSMTRPTVLFQCDDQA